VKSFHRIVVVGLSAVVLASGPSQLEATSAGTTGASFLKLSVGARAEAMGDAGVVGLEGVESLYWNPAGLAGDGGAAQCMVSHQQLWQGVNATSFAVALPGLRIGSVALGIEQLGVDSWNNLADSPGIEASDLAVLLGVGRSLTAGMDVGIAARTLHSKIGDHSASGFSVDCGLRYRLTDRLTLAGAVRNMGSGLSFVDGGSDPLPLMGGFGGVLAWEHLSLLAEARKERGTDAYGALGAEIRLHPMLALRAGSRLGSDEGRATSNASWGVGVGLPASLRFDYSYRDSDLGSSHQFSGTYLFGGGGGGPNGPGAGGGETSIASNLTVVQGLLAGAVDSLLTLMPLPASRDIVAKREGVEEAGRAREPEDGTGDDLLEAILAERLTRMGLVVHMGSLVAAVEDSAGGEAPSSDMPVLEYRILELKVDYPSARRRHYVGRKEMERLAQVHVHLRLLEGPERVVRWAGTAERSYRDIVPFSLVKSLRSEGFGFTDPETEDRKWDRVLEPVIATAIVGGLIFLFYSNKGSD
jgi:hypothetical protein